MEQLQWLLLSFNSCFQKSPGQKPVDYVQYIPDLAEKGICWHENPKAATVGVLQKKAYNFNKKAPVLENF